MGKHRMFSLDVVNSDAFLDMPLSAQALYFHFGMRADDDGFVPNPRRIQAYIGASMDDLKLLAAKRFILTFDSGIIVIKHWRLHNYIRKDRYKPTLYQDEKKTLFIKRNGVYTDHPLPPGEAYGEKSLPEASADDAEDDPPGLGDEMTTKRQPNDNQMTPQDKVSKDKLSQAKSSQDKTSNFNYLSGGDDARASAKAIREYFGSRSLDPMLYFGTTDDLLAEVDSITKAIFANLGGRVPTPADGSAVFMAITQHKPDETTGDIERFIPKDSLDLLLYAFEQAVCAGKPGNWNYINGVLARLSQRGITTLADAEAYDDERYR